MGDGDYPLSTILFSGRKLRNGLVHFEVIKIIQANAAPGEDFRVAVGERVDTVFAVAGSWFIRVPTRAAGRAEVCGTASGNVSSS